MAIPVSAAKLTEHGLHVSFNEERSAYEGLPEEWKHVNQQFGVPLSQVPRVAVEAYAERIPALLVMMRRELEKGNGRDQVGIFRLAPDADDCKAAKTEMNRGDFRSGTADVNVIANLIKVFFRDMDEGLLNAVPERTIYRVADMPFSAVSL